MKTVIKTEQDLAKVLMQVSMLASEIKEKPYEVEIKPYKEKRSLNANAYFHLLVHKIAERLKMGNDEIKKQMNLEYGTPLRIDEDTLFAFKVPKGARVEEVVKYPKWVKETTENGREYDVYMVYKETHTLDISEMNRLIQGVVDEAKQLGIETKSPDEIANMLSLWATQEE